jgi:hypothetical protein
VFGNVFSECLYDGVGESHFVVYAVVGNRLLQRLGNDYASAIVFAVVVFRCHVLQHENAWPLFTHGSYQRLCDDGSMRLCEGACKCLVERDARTYAR